MTNHESRTKQGEREANPKSALRNGLVGLLVLATVGLLAGCGGAAAPGEPGPEEVMPVVAQEPGKVIAEAVIEPARWSELRFEGGGTVVEVLVEEEDLVSEGDLLVRLDPTDAELAVQKAEAALASAKAQLELMKAGPRPEEIAKAEAQLEAAGAMLSQAVAQRDELTAGAVDAEIASAQAQLAAAQAEQEQAEELHDMTMKCFKFKLPDGTELEICPGLGPFEEQTRYQLHAATGALAAAYAQLDAQQGGAEARLQAAQAGVWEASARWEVAQAQLDLLKAGSTAEDIGVAEAAVRQARWNTPRSERLSAVS
jgi:multidrug resistance efflux pump